MRCAALCAAAAAAAGPPPAPPARRARAAAHDGVAVLGLPETFTAPWRARVMLRPPVPPVAGQALDPTFPRARYDRLMDWVRASLAPPGEMAYHRGYLTVWALRRAGVRAWWVSSERERDQLARDRARPEWCVALKSAARLPACRRVVVDVVDKWDFLSPRNLRGGRRAPIWEGAAGVIVNNAAMRQVLLDAGWDPLRVTAIQHFTTNWNRTVKPLPCPARRPRFRVVLMMNFFNNSVCSRYGPLARAVYSAGATLQCATGNQMAFASQVLGTGERSLQTMMLKQPWGLGHIYSQVFSRFDAVLVVGKNQKKDIFNSVHRIYQPMSVGVPVLAQKVPAAAELDDWVREKTGQGYAGFWDTPAELRERITALRTDGGRLCKLMVEQGRAAAQQYTPEATMKQYLGLFARIKLAEARDSKKKTDGKKPADSKEATDAKKPIGK